MYIDLIESQRLGRLTLTGRLLSERFVNMMTELGQSEFDVHHKPSTCQVLLTVQPTL